MRDHCALAQVVQLLNLLLSDLEDEAIIKKSCSSCWSYLLATSPVSIDGDRSLPFSKQVQVAQKVNIQYASFECIHTEDPHLKNNSPFK